MKLKNYETALYGMVGKGTYSKDPFHMVAFEHRQVHPFAENVTANFTGT